MTLGKALLTAFLSEVDDTNQQCAGKPVRASQLSIGARVGRVEKPWIIVFAYFHSVNNANIIDIKLSM